MPVEIVRDVDSLQREIIEAIEKKDFSIEISKGEAQVLLREYASLVYSCTESMLDLIENGYSKDKVEIMRTVLSKFAKIRMLHYKID